MSLSKNQVPRYWREWKATCLVQGWKQNDEARRRALHAAAGCPASMRDFDKKLDFDRYLAHCAALQNRVDITDRERERVETAIERLDAAICAIEGKEPGEYLRGILLDMHDAGDTLDLPLDPRDEQQKRGVEKVRPDLANLRDTLANRLSRLLAQLKGTAKKQTRPSEHTCPEALKWALAVACRPAIEAIIAGRIAVQVWIAPGKCIYKQLTRAEYEALQARKQQRRAPAAEPVQPPRTTRRKPRRAGRQAMRESAETAAALAALGPIPGEEDDNMPF